MDGGHHDDPTHHVQHYTGSGVGSGVAGRSNTAGLRHQPMPMPVNAASSSQHHQHEAAPGSQLQQHTAVTPASQLAQQQPSQSSLDQDQQSVVGGAVVNKPIRRRMRMITSCLECRRRKLKCNKRAPCENCDKFARECVYLGSKLDEASQLRLTEIKEKVGSLERALERDVAKSASSRMGKQASFVVDDIDYEYAEDLEVWPADSVGVDATLEDDVPQGAEDVMDLGVQVGRMRLTDRVGGLSRPGLSEQIAAGLPGPIPGLASRTQNLPPSMGGPGMNVLPSGRPPDGTIPDFMQPGPTYIAPSGSLVFGKAVNAGPALDTLLPSRAASDRLMDRYFRSVHPIARCVHQPSFEADYEAFWEEVCANFEPRASTQALMFAAMFSAATSLDPGTAVQEFGVDRPTLIENLKLGTETALCKSSFLRSTRFETLQALVMYLIPLCRAEISRAHSVLVGAAIRMAECMSVHRDGEAFGLNPVDTHIRRLIWHQLCFLDIRTAEAHGPRPFIRREDYDTRLPMNCDESSILPGGPSPGNETRWTTMLLPLIRFEVNEMMRIVWMDRRKLESKKITLTEVLAKTENFRKRMIEKYERLLDDQIPIQRYAKLLMHLLLYRLYAMILHAYHHSPGAQLPARLNNVVVMAGIMIIEIAIQLENDRQFRDWVWYFGAYSQYQIALLLATEVYFRPQNRESARIWACLDYVFDLDRGLPPEVKGVQIFSEVMSKTAIYHSLRKTRSIPRGAQTTAGNTPKSQTGSLQPQQSQTQNVPAYYQQPANAMGPPPVTSASSSSSIAALASNYSVVGAHWAATTAAGVGVGAGNSPETSNVSEGGSVGSGAAHSTLPHMSQQQGSASASASTGRGLEGIDWDTLNAIFPPDPTTGEINLAGYHDPSISMNWQQWR